MDQEKFGNFIREIRKKNNLTQSELAEKYNVTSQAVSKWENGKNLPDKTLILQMSKDFGVSVEYMMSGNDKEKIKGQKYLTITAIFVLLFGVTFFCVIHFNKLKDFEFKTLTTNCKDFNISGNIAYNDNKSAIYITNIQYCGGEDSKEYKTIECKLYESTSDIERKISSYKYDDDKKIKLEEFLKEVTFSIDEVTKTCKEYGEDSFYLMIDAIGEDERTTIYKIPLKLNDSCN